MLPSFFPAPEWRFGEDLRSGVRLPRPNYEMGMTWRRKAVRRKIRIGATLLLALLAVSACEGIEPYEPRNNREEGPKNGLLTGEEGEFVIFRLRSKPKGEEAPQDGDEEIETQEEESETQDSQ